MSGLFSLKLCFLQKRTKNKGDKVFCNFRKKIYLPETYTKEYVTPITIKTIMLPLL